MLGELSAWPQWVAYVWWPPSEIKKEYTNNQGDVFKSLLKHSCIDTYPNNGYEIKNQKHN